jgi:hypothetical protein
MVADIIDGYRQYFAGRDDVFAFGRVDYTTNKARYFMENAALTDDVLQSHIEGTELVGVYPMSPESKVKWFALDVDHAKDEDGNVVPEPFPQAWQDAVAQANALEAAGLHVYLERSRSGEGVHVWGFLDDWVDAALVRKAIKPLLISTDTFDRMYPVQDELSEKKPYGNLIALPFHGQAIEKGNGMFLDKVTGEEIAISYFLDNVRTNSPAVIAMLAAKAPKTRQSATGNSTDSRSLPVVEMGADGGRPSRPLVGVLKLVSHYGCDFMRNAYAQRKALPEPAWYAAIGQLTCFENGRDAAHVFSMGHAKYNASEVDSKYDHALENPPVGCAYIHEHFPRQACKSCPMLAPYRKADRKLANMIQDGGTDLAVGGFKKYLPKVWALDSGEERSGIPWGFGGLDQFTRFRPSELTVLGAQVSMGKTASMVHLSTNVAAAGFAARVFSAEMGEDELRARYLSHIAGVDSRAIRGERHEKLTKAERKLLEEAAETLDRLPLEFNYTATRPETILVAIERSLLRQRLPLEGPYVSFFDYIQFAAREAGDNTPRERISRTAKELKLLAKVSRNAHCAFSQVRRDTEGNDEPDVTWFKESGDIEAEMDVGGVLTGARVEGRTAPRVITLVKQRNGIANVRAEFLFDMSTSTFEPVRQYALTERPALFGDGELGDDSST